MYTSYTSYTSYTYYTSYTSLLLLRVLLHLLVLVVPILLRPSLLLLQIRLLLHVQYHVSHSKNGTVQGPLSPSGLDGVLSCFSLLL
jgi:hypothetical protein